tara:strand:- start:5784 stop:6239 length:456 start_codon:yes stop_codon:yes gene_type:complete
MENKTIEWGWEKGQPSNMRSKEHQEFLIEQYNRNRPVDKQVSTMEELDKALKTNDIVHHGMRSVTITERRVYHKVAKITIELPKDLPIDDTEEWLDNNKAKWEQSLDNKFNDATLDYGLGFNNPSCDGMNESMADRETRYYVNGEKYGGHI